MNVAGHGNETRITPLFIGESEFIFCCCCCENMVFPVQEIGSVDFYRGVLSLCRLNHPLAYLNSAGLDISNPNRFGLKSKLSLDWIMWVRFD